MPLPNELTFRGRPLLLMEPHSVDSKPLVRSMRGEVAEAITGARIVETKSEIPGGVHQLDFVAQTRADAKFLEDFFDARMGSAEGFWCPTWQWEFEIRDHYEFDAFQFWVWIRRSGYGPGPYTLGDAFRWLMFLYADTYTIENVIEVTANHPSGTNWERLKLSQQAVTVGGFGASAPFTEAKGVRPLWLRYVRFADDEIETQELGDVSSLVTVRIAELPRETP